MARDGSGKHICRVKSLIWCIYRVTQLCHDTPMKYIAPGRLDWRMNMNKVWVAAAAGVLMGISGASMAAGDAAAGKAKAATCAGCHGAAGVSANPLWPNLAGQKDAYLVKQIKAFRDGTRTDPMMSPMAKPLSDADIENLAAYFSSL